jgi:Icc-related predicted phosphoesterase
MNKYEKVEEMINGGSKVTAACKAYSIPASSLYSYRYRVRKQAKKKGVNVVIHQPPSKTTARRPGGTTHTDFVIITNTRNLAQVLGALQ